MNKLAKILENLIKAEIKKQDLIDTGALYKSISVRSKGDGFSFDIEAEDYFEFVDNKFKVTEKVFNSKQWEQAVEEAVYDLINEKLNIE